MMSLLLHRSVSVIVLLSFVFQVLWPSVVFARVEVPLGAAWQDNPYGLTFKVNPFKDSKTNRELLRVQAFANPQEDWHDAKPTPNVSAKPSAPESLKTLLDRVVDIKDLRAVESESAYALYQDLTITEAGIGWAFGGLAFVLDWQGNVVTTGTSKFDMAVTICTGGNVDVDHVLVKQLLAKGKNVLLRGTGGIERLDAWATGDGTTPGKVLMTKDSSQTIKQLYLHQGQGENHGHLTVQETLQQTETFDNQATLTLAKDATVQGGKVFANAGTVEGESYTLQSEVIRNQGEGTQKAILQASQKVTLAAKKLEQKGQLIGPGVDLSQVEQIEDNAAALLQAEQLQTQLHKDWTLQGQVEVKSWQDTSKEEVLIKNQGTLITHQETSLAARYRTLKGGKSDLTGVSFNNAKDRYQPLVNEGEVTLRKVKDLGSYHQDIENKAGASLIFLDCGVSSAYARDPSGMPRWGGLHLGKVDNAGTIGFGNGTYRLHGVFSQTETGIHEVLPGQELWAKDILNDGVAHAPHGYRINQRSTLFTKLGKILVKGKLITQISEQAVRHKTGGTTYQHQDHFEADDWVDESDPTVTIENLGTLITRKSATLSAQFFTGKGGMTDLRGVSLAAPLVPDQPLVNYGKTIFRHVQSLGSAYRPILNQPGGKLAFLEGTFSQTHGKASTGGLTIGDMMNYGILSFGGGDYYTGVLFNHHIQEALGGQKLHPQDLINHGELRSDKGYRIDMSRRTFTKLGKVVVTGGGPTTLLFPQGVNAGQYLADNHFQDWQLEGDLRIEAPYLHNTVDWLFKIPVSLGVETFLNDALIHTHGLTLQAKTLAQGTLGGRLGQLKSTGKLEIEVEGDVDTRRGVIEALAEGVVTSKTGDILVGHPVGSNYRQKNGAYIFAHQKLCLNSRNLVVTFGEIGSKKQLELTFLDRLFLESATLKAMGRTRFQGRSVLIKRADPYYSHGETVCDWRYWCDQWRQRDGGDASKLLLGHDLELWVDEMAVVASDIAVAGNVTDKDKQKITQDQPRQITFKPMPYYEHAKKNPGDKWPETVYQVYDSRASTFSCAGQVELAFDQYQLAGVLMSAAQAILAGDRFLLGSDTQQSTSGVVPYQGNRGSLLPFILALQGGITQYRTPTQNSYVVYSTGSLVSNVIDPSLMALVQTSLKTSSSAMPNPLGDQPLRYLVDVEGLMGALQLFLMAATGKSYVFPKEEGINQIRRLLENGLAQKKSGKLTPAEVKQSLEPSLTWQEDWYEGELVYVPYLHVPQKWLQTYFAKPSRGSMVMDESISVNMTSFLGTSGAVMAVEDDNITLTSGGDIDLKAVAERQHQGQNYQDTKVGGEFHVPNGGLKITAANDLDTTAVTVKTRDGAKLVFQGDRTDHALPLPSHSETQHGDSKTVNHQVNHAVSEYEHTGEGAGQQELGNPLTSHIIRYAPRTKASKAQYQGASHQELDVHDTFEQTTTTKESNGLFSGKNEKQEKHQSSTSKGAVYEGNEHGLIEVIYDVFLGNSVHTNVDWRQCRKVVFYVPTGRVFLLAGQNHEQHSTTEFSANGFWQWVEQDTKVDQTYSPCQFSKECEIQIDSPKQVYIQSVKGQTLQWLEGLKAQGIGFELEELEPLHLTHHFETDGPTAGLMIVVGLGVTLATMGAGSHLGATLASTLGLTTTTAAGTTALTTAGMILQGMTAATFSSLCTSAAGALLQNNFDPHKALKAFMKTETFLKAMKAAATAGLLKGLGTMLDAPTSAVEATNKSLADALKAAQACGMTDPTALELLKAALPHQAAFQALNMGVNVALDVVFQQSLEKSFGQGAVNFAASLLGGLGANQIGAAYAQGVLDALTHKLLHAGLGATTGAIMAKEKGALAGAMGAFVAETFAEMLSPDKPMQKMKALQAEKGRPLTAQEFTDYYQAELQAYQPRVGQVEDWAHLTAATAALLAHQDVTVASMAAKNAVENNFALLAFYGVMAASVAYSGYQVYNAYEEGGPTAALQQLGIEVVVNAGGAVVGRAVGAVVYKVGGIAYPTLQAALTAVLDKTPELRMALGKMVDKLVLASDAVAQSALGKAAAKAEQKLTQMESKIWDKLRLRGAAEKDFFKDAKYSDKVLRQMRQEDYHAFPESVSAFQGDGKVSKIIGGDGIERLILRIPGEYRGKKGMFELIKEADGTINHRLFRPDIM